MTKARLAALVVGLLVLLIMPAGSAEVATPNDTARLLAGLPPEPGSPLAAIAKDPNWERHANHFNSVFGRVDQTHLSKVREFSKTRLNTTHDTMLYLFGGPDALHAVAFFPKASNYVLSGLEPVGDIPELTSIPRSAVLRTLQNLEASLSTLVTMNYFITAHMQSQLSSGPVYGALPVIYVLLARSGKSIHEMSFVNLDNDGSPRAPTGPGDKATAKGAKIVFSGDDGRRQTLYYFSTNLANEATKNGGFLAFCDKLGTADSLVKSASYLLHNGEFSTVRNFLLDHSGTILQDDTGVPVNYFDRKKWQVQPFGRYIVPIPIFAGQYQPQMADLYLKGKPIPLEFGIGYRPSLQGSNLLLAEKIAGADSVASRGEGPDQPKAAGRDGNEPDQPKTAGRDGNEQVGASYQRPTLRRRGLAASARATRNREPAPFFLFLGQ
jgi:hypothetical protein